MVSVTRMFRRKSGSHHFLILSSILPLEDPSSTSGQTPVAHRDSSLSQCIPSSEGADAGRPQLPPPLPPVRAQIKIVDPATRRELPRGETGELWVTSPCVAAGYWGKPELSRETFGASLADGEEAG